MAKKVPFRDRLRATMLAAQLEEELENNEYNEPDASASNRGAPPSRPDNDGSGDMLDRQIDTLDDSLSNNLPDWFTNQSVHTQTIYHSNPHTNKHSNRQTTQHSKTPIKQHSPRQSHQHSPVPTTMDPVMCMTDTQANILAFLMDNSIQVIKYDELVNLLGIPYGTVRWAIAKLEKENFLSKRKFRKGRVQGIAVSLNETLCTHFYEKRIKGEHKKWHPDWRSNKQSVSHSNALTVQQTDTLADRLESSKIDRKEDSSSIKKKILALGEGDIEFFYPNLHRIGFGVSQLRQIVDKLEMVGKEPDKIITSMEYADWELAQGELKDKEGKVVRNPCAFVFMALARTGYYRRPPGYVSAEELAANDLQEEARRVRMAKEKKEKAEFEIWKESLAKEELAEIMRSRIGPEEQWLFNHYKTKIKDN